MRNDNLNQIVLPFVAYSIRQTSPQVLPSGESFLASTAFNYVLKIWDDNGIKGRTLFRSFSSSELVRMANHSNSELCILSNDLREFSNRIANQKFFQRDYQLEDV